MKTIFATYPWAYFTPGGGEYQLEKLYKAIKKTNYSLEKFNCWEPQVEFEIYHYFSCIGGSFDFCNYLKEVGKKLVISSSLWITKKNIHNYPIEEIKRQLNLADKIITNSKMETSLLSDTLSINQEKFEVVHNGYDSKLIEFRNKKEIPSYNITQVLGKDYIYCLANIEPRKNQHVLIEACRKLNLNLVLAGNIRDHGYFSKLNIKKDDSLIKFIGPIKHNSEVYFSLFSNAKCFVLPSKLETPGLAALEAAAYGLPLIITSEGSALEYFGDLKTYYDGDQSDIDKLCDILEYVVNNPSNGIVDEEQIKKFTWDNCALRQIEIYKNLL